MSAIGALPDMLTFTPDGRHLLVANEGEPRSHGNPALFSDLEGSVSIIRVPLLPAAVKRLTDADVRTAGFSRFNGQEAALRARDTRISPQRHHAKRAVQHPCRRVRSGDGRHPPVP